MQIPKSVNWFSIPTATIGNDQEPFNNWSTIQELVFYNTDQSSIVQD
jgi:hypothetical protein